MAAAQQIKTNEPGGDQSSPPILSIEANDYVLPPAGASSAGDMQRRLSESVLRGFYAPIETPNWSSGRRIAAVFACALASWALVFGIGALLIR